MASMSRSICWLCYKVASPTLKGVVRHMAAVHAHDPHFFICCGIQGCSRTYSNFFSFKKHLYRKHRASLDMSGPFVADSSFRGSSEHGGSNFVSDVEDVNEERPHIVSNFQHMKQMALFLLKTREVRKVSQVALDGIIADFTQMHERTVNELKLEVRACLQAKGMSISAFEGLEDVFHDPRKIEPFRRLNSKFLQEKFYREHLHLLVSRKGWQLVIYVHACMQL